MMPLRLCRARGTGAANRPAGDTVDVDAPARAVAESTPPKTEETPAPPETEEAPAPAPGEPSAPTANTGVPRRQTRL